MNPVTTMTNTLGARRFTDSEKAMLLTSISDYMLFGVQEQEMLQLLAKKLGRPISPRIFYNLKKEVRERNGSADEWLDKYARAHLADFYRQRIDELQYLQANLFLILDNEKNKGGVDKINVYRYNTIAKTIIENSKVLADYGMGAPIIAKIKDLLPVDINELNKRVERQKSLVDNAINIDDDTIIESSDTITENEQSTTELERLQETRKSAKSAFRLQPDEQDARESSGESEYSSSEDEYHF